MAIPWAALSLIPAVPPLLRGASNNLASTFKALQDKGLAGVAQHYLSGNAARSYYTGMLDETGNIFTVPKIGDVQDVAGQRKRWDGINGWQLPNTTGTSTRESPIKYGPNGAPIDPNTGQYRTGNISVPSLEPDPPAPDNTPTLASVPPKAEHREVIDPEKARAAVAAAEKYKKEQADILEAHKNYKTMREFGGEPVVTQDYMEQDAMKIWANANPELAKKLIEKHQLNAGDIFSKPGESNMPVPKETPFTGATTVAQLLSPNSTGTNWNNLSTEPVGNISGLFSNPESILGQAGDKNKFFYTSKIPTAMPMVDATVNTQMPSITIAGNGFKYN